MRLIICMAIAWFLVSSVKKEEACKMLDYSNTTNCEFDSLANFYARFGIRFKRVVTAQSIWETNWFSSKIYEECCNRFGMKYNQRGYAVKQHRGHAFYNNSIKSIQDYKAWQDRVLELRPVETEKEYLKLLNNLPLCKGGCRYAEDTTYTTKVIGIIKKYSCDEVIH